jgi:hypothetical protein
LCFTEKASFYVARRVHAASFTQNQIDNFTEFFTFNPEGNAKLSIFFGGQGVGTRSLTASP